ncbi:hypothetical protein [Lactococcus lactis]|uniref:hypothetical protein n=1 Tax=Lactococcus lactis TaxID=1358 RepID=UPI00223AD94A|nr:hypothetical protein [Lactococcus lactis]MCT1181323.1 hypothetical protein [Lactococcus lactis]
MLINVLDKDLKVVAFIDNEVPNLPNYYEDEFNEYLDLGTCSFDFTVKKLNEKGEVNDYVIYLNDKTCFSFIRNGKEYAVFPAGSSGFYENDFEVRYQCLSLDRELSLEYVGKLENTTSHNLEWYINNSAVISNSQIEIGVNEVANQTRVLNYDGEDTKLNRLLSLISNFDAEFEFVTKLSSSGAVDKTILNIVRERDEEGNFGIGLNRSDVSLTYGKDVYGIERTYDFDFFNYSVITGKDGLSWFSKSFKYYNSEGVLEFYKPANSHGAMAPLSAEKYPAHLKNNASDKYIRKDFNTEYTTVNQMWGYAVQQFKAHAYPKVSYTIKTSSKLIIETFENSTPLNIGDTVTIQDDNFISEYGSYGLILSARVVQIKSSESNPEKNEIIFNNFKELRGEISDDLLQKMNDLISEITPYRLEINTTNGVQFKNGTGTTTLGAHIYFGSDTTETTADSYEWSKDGTVVANVQEITVDASGVADKAVYSFKATVAGKVVASQSVTITNVNDGAKGAQGPQGPQGERGIAGATGATGSPGPKGADGRSSYIHIKYAPVINPTDSQITDTPNAYIGVYTDYNQADSTSASAYTWSKWQGEDGANGVAGAKGADGRTTYVHFAYANSTNGQTNFSTSYFDGALYMGTLTDYTQTDSTNYAAYTWSRLKGDKGDKGDQGIQGLQGPTGNQGVAGPKGADGKTQYTHIAYANSADGVTDFSTSDSNRAYIGMYVDFNVNDSTTPSDYSWTLVKGADGTQGTPGKPGADGKTPYFHTAWSYSADGTDGFSTVYPNLNLLNNTRITQENLNVQNWSAGVGSSLSVGSNNGIKVINNGGGLGSQGGFAYGSTINVKAGDAITVSCYTKNTGTVDINNFSLSIAFYGSSNAYPAKGNLVIPTGGKYYFFSFTTIVPNGVTTARPRWFDVATVVNEKHIFEVYGMKLEQSSTATPYMPSASEVTTADYPRYIGQYTDFAQADSTNPSAYTWSLIRGNDGKDGANGKDGLAGKDGVGIKTTVITYAISISGTTAPTTGWTSSVPSLVKGQYLWTKTVWTYTDNSFETGYSVTYIAKDGNNGNDGIAGKDGTGIKTTTITYAGSTSGTTAPNSGWTTTVPTVAAGSYLWTKTVWAYTDNTSETGYSVAKMGNNGATGPQGPQGNTGPQGPTGPAGSDGNPGKIVSDTEPTTRFKGLTWKYLGTSDLRASDGTVILSGTEYYWSGTNWILNEINAHNINGDNLSVTNGTFTDGKIKSTWNSGTASGSTEIENSHINMSATDSTSKATNSLGLDVQQGLGMRWSDPTSNQSRSVLLDYGNLVFDRNGVAAGLNFDGTNLSSSMPIQAPNTIVKSTSFTVSGMGIRLDRLMSFVAVTFFGRASSTISNQTINSMLPVGYRPITPYSIDYMLPGHIADNGYIYFNPDGSIAIMTTINSGYYIRGTRLYITNDVYPS